VFDFLGDLFGGGDDGSSQISALQSQLSTSNAALAAEQARSTAQAGTITKLEGDLTTSKTSLDKLWQAVTGIKQEQADAKTQQATSSSTTTRNLVIGAAVLAGLYLIWRAS